MFKIGDRLDFGDVAGQVIGIERWSEGDCQRVALKVRVRDGRIFDVEAMEASEMPMMGEQEGIA